MAENIQYHGKIDLREPVKPIIPYGKPGAAAEIITPFYLTDDLAYIGTVKVGCFAIKTSEGVVLIDSLETPDAYETLILPGLKMLGLENEKVLACFISHGHFDHHCGAGMLREKTGCKLIISAIDARIMPNPGPHGIVHPYPKTIDVFCEDGDEFTYGDKTIYVSLTPGHTPGGISLIFNVKDHGEEHMACIWGGTGLPNSLYACCDYLKSAAAFSQFCVSKGADIEISAHPFVDNLLENKAKLEKRALGEPNPFVIGAKGVSDFFYQRIVSAMAEIAKYANQM